MNTNDDTNHEELSEAEIEYRGWKKGLKELEARLNASEDDGSIDYEYIERRHTLLVIDITAYEQVQALLDVEVTPDMDNEEYWTKVARQHDEDQGNYNYDY